MVLTKKSVFTYSKSKNQFTLTQGLRTRISLYVVTLSITQPQNSFSDLYKQKLYYFILAFLKSTFNWPDQSETKNCFLPISVIRGPCLSPKLLHFTFVHNLFPNVANTLANHAMPKPEKDLPNSVVQYRLSVC